ncbi:hypothetical protein PCYB_103480 [Plasmodium cynomolgi strain B]|uniref:Transcription factor 25 n=1 Tax=Plasmodium cynomolgi (strain B) TaxID=1120755 RepID=K6UKP7_PLACD|nr:hypothetical protein PCYB_103480 [Plasmodium cynomolgi strain B]GAB66998.1 hypothetical protein PCYB_103480 [Plasmodium cynomolgi strain B]
MKRYANEFKLEKYKLYLEAENLFYVLLDTHDIEAMHNLIKKFPFHVDTLLVLSEYYNENNNFEVANKFTKLALLLLQHIFHIDFHPNNLNKRRNIYVNPYLYDNKALFKALYMHMVSLENEACTITSLEVAKLLCKIDLQYDLCSILLRIDSLILKCTLFDFLIYFSFNFVIQNVHCEGCKGCKVCEDGEAQTAGNALQSKLLFDNFEIRLHFILPNFAFSLPLSMYLKNNNFVDHQEIRVVSVDDLVSAFTYEECRFLSPHFSIRFNCHRDGERGGHDRLGQSDNAEDDLGSAERDQSNPPKVSTKEQKKKQPSLSFSAHVTLLRALLCFPSFLHTFLNYNNFKTTKVVKKTIYETSFKDILASPPFSSASLFPPEEYETVQKIIRCYLEKNNIYYKSEKIITWFHVCSSFLHELYKDPSAAQALDKARAQWHAKVPLLDKNKYKDVRVGEFKSSNYLLPDFMMEKNRTYSPHTPGTSSNYYVSLNSNLIIAFFQSLLPWYQVDYYGYQND